MTFNVKFSIANPVILSPGESQEVTGTIFADGIEPQTIEVRLQNYSGFYQVDERISKHIFGEMLDLYSDGEKQERIDISTIPFSSEYQFLVEYPSFAMTDRLGSTIPFELSWSIGHDNTFSQSIDTIGEISYAPQLLPPPDIFSVEKFSAEQMLELRKYIKNSTTDIAITSTSINDAESMATFEFSYFQTPHSLDENQDITTRFHFLDLDEPALFQSSFSTALLSSISSLETAAPSESDDVFFNSYATQYWLAQINYQNEHFLDNMFFLIEMSDGTYHFDRSKRLLSKFANNPKEDFENGAPIAFASEFDWQIQIADTPYSEYHKLDENRLLFWEHGTGQGAIFDVRNKESITFSYLEFGTDDQIADAILEADGSLILLIAASDGVGGHHYFLKLYDISGEHYKTTLLSNNAYDGSLIKLENEYYGIIIDRAIQVTNSDLSSFSLPMEYSVGQQFTEHLLGLSWINLELDDGDNTYFSKKDNDTIMALEGDDHIVANAGNDIIDGGGGDDLIVGSEGDDYIEGGIGSDTLIGGSGNDTFYFNKQSETGGNDVIEDFSASEDRLVFSGFESDEIVFTLNHEGDTQISFVDENTIKIKSNDDATNLVLDNFSDGKLVLYSSDKQTNVTVDADKKISAQEVTFDTVKILGMTDFEAQFAQQNPGADAISISDVILQLKQIVGLETLHGNSKVAGDVNNDGEISIADVIANLKHIVGLEKIDTVDLVTKHGLAINELSVDSIGNLTLVANGDVDQSFTNFIL